MLLWIGFALLTAAVVAALMAPLRRELDGPLEAGAADLAVYRDQLAEIEAEHQRGLFSEAEVEGARVEVARRLIKRADDEDATSARPSVAPAGVPPLPRTVFYAIAGLIPAFSVAAYLVLGAPALPSRPFAARLDSPAEQASVAELVARVEARLKEHPEDGQGWDVIAPVYLRLERYGDAARAYAQANTILGETAKRLLGFAEAGLLASNGVVTEDVRRAAERILVLEPDRPEARLWLALAKEQDGDLAGAIADYNGILAGSAPDAPWRKPVNDRLELLSRQLAAEPAPRAQGPRDGQAAAAAQATGPAPADVARVEQMSPAERSEFIGRMVEGLAERLKQDGNDLPGWLRLVQAYKVLGRNGEAVAALGEARRHFEGDQKSLQELEQLAKSLGLGS
jgi:cytochrome c-type biogenesis protein CcmH